MENVDQTAHELYRNLSEEESALIFDTFSRNAGLKIGLKIIVLAKCFSDPIAIEIVINGLTIFRYFSDGAFQDSELWLSRKRNSVELMSMSSLRFKAWLEQFGKTLASRNLSSKEYAACGGGVPIIIKNTGMIGSICVSGLPNHIDDHKLIVEAIVALKN